MHEYQQFVDYNHGSNGIANPFQSTFIGSSMGPAPVARPITTPAPIIMPMTAQHIVKIEPQNIPNDTSDGSKPYKCSQCGYSSSLKSNLNQHMTCVHASVKPFKCTLCDYAAAIKSNLNQHIQCVHVKTKPYKCTQCAMFFIANYLP